MEFYLLIPLVVEFERLLIPLSDGTDHGVVEQVGDGVTHVVRSLHIGKEFENLR